MIRAMFPQTIPFGLLDQGNYIISPRSSSNHRSAFSDRARNDANSSTVTNAAAANLAIFQSARLEQSSIQFTAVRHSTGQFDHQQLHCLKDSPLPVTLIFSVSSACSVS